MTGDSSFLEQVIAATRLNALVAPFTVRRVLIRSNVDPDSVTTEDIRRLLPRFREALAVYLRDEELARALRDLEALAGPDERGEAS